MNVEQPGVQFPKIIVVLLRRPRRTDPSESRSDPYWEFGSFGSTYCHSKNLMNPRRALELNGAQLAFAQGGPSGFRLVYVTPPIKVRYRMKGTLVEATWVPGEMPLRYDASPIIVDGDGRSDCPQILREIRDVKRSTWPGRFASAFRTRRYPVAGVVGAELIRVYESRRATHVNQIARTYVEALPYPPPHIESDPERKRRYRSHTEC